MRKWYQTVEPENDIVVSSRVRIARNIKAVPFPKRMNDAQKNETLEGMKALLDGVSLDPIGTLRYIDMQAVPPEEIGAMVERHLISPDFAEKQGPRGLVVSEDETVSVMLLEEDHIRIQVLLPGLALEQAYRIAQQVEELFAKGLTLAFDGQLGYLTECPTNLGTGLRASVMLHLPVLESTGSIIPLAESVSKIGLTVRGMYGEGSRSHAALYQLSNQVTLGISEQGAIENLNAIAMQVVQKEKTARRELEPTAVEDMVYRALGTLKYARRLSGEEMMNLISRVKLGVSMGILKEVPPELPMTLLIENQPATLQRKYGRMTAEERDVCRAKIIRESL